MRFTRLFSVTPSKMPSQSLWRNIALLSAIFAVALCAFAADVSGRIKGTVTDPAGAVLNHATIVATNKDTGVNYTTVSLSNGDYLFQQLPVGTYSITVTVPGFKSFTASGIVLTIDSEYVEAVKMEVGNTTEVVSVTADAVQVNTTDMQLNNVVNSDQIVELPLINRTFTGLELTLPGVQASSDRFSSNYSVSGGQTQQSEYLINGADTNDISLNTLVLAPNLDAIDQFNLIDGPLNAEYDRNSGGIVSATIKSGTNKFHGDGFEFYRDTFLNTLSYFQKNVNTGEGVVSPYHQHIFGGTVGGPIFKDKLFFFGAYQGTRQRVPQAGGSASVFTSANLNGNFSAEDNGPGLDSAPGPTDTWGNYSANAIPATIQITGCTTEGETWSQCAYALNGVFNPANFSSIATALDDL